MTDRIVLSPDDSERVLKLLKIPDDAAVAPIVLVDGPEPHYSFALRIAVTEVERRKPGRKPAAA